LAAAWEQREYLSEPDATLCLGGAFHPSCS
jgi:hypothetical protein